MGKKIWSDSDVMGNNNSNGICFQLSPDTEIYGGVQECRIYTDYPEKGGKLKRIVSAAEQTSCVSNRLTIHLTHVKQALYRG